MKKYYGIKAFTLAEVLLTLIVIGVISVLTVPAIKNHSEEAKYVAATQKAMAEIAAATSNAELAYGDAAMWDFSSNAVEYYKKVMNVVPFSSDSKTSWERYNLSGTKTTFPASFITADGMAWSIGTGGYSCGGGVALVDVNGSQPPNTIGIDIQGFRIGHLCENDTKKGDFGIYAMGDGINDTNSAWACTSYIIKHKKMPWMYASANDCSSYQNK